jgi:hypothetical protein
VASPAVDCSELLAQEADLRRTGAIVIKSLGGIIDPRCSQQLVRIEGKWLLKPVEKK